MKDTGIWDVKTKATLIESGEELQPVETEKAIRQEDFKRLVGKIQWLAIVTRPDITYAVSRLTSVANGPSEAAWTAIKRLLRYLRRTVEMRLTYGGSEPLRGYSDAN